MYVNLGFGTDGPWGGPPNMSNPMVPPFQILGPSRNPYPGTICLPQVPLPANATVKAGDNATIQVVELAVHGAALYSVCHDDCFPRCSSVCWTPDWSASPRPLEATGPLSLSAAQCTNIPSQCVDITFVEPTDPRLADVNESNCFNSNDIGFADVYTIVTRDSGAGNTTSGAEMRFWYFGKQRDTGSAAVAMLLGWLPVVLGGLWLML